MNDVNLMKKIIEILNDNSTKDLTPEDVQAWAEQRLAAAKARHQRRVDRFAQALNRTTDIQTVVIDKLELDNYRSVKIWTSRVTGKVAVMMQRDGVWDAQKGAIRTKLYMVYPDGRHQSAFGKITLQTDWF